MDRDLAAARRCDVCGSSSMAPWLKRCDALAVLQCGTCGMGVVEAVPTDLDTLYRGDYYGGDRGSAWGYEDYAYTAEHSVGWVGPMVDLLVPGGGSALDIGCADGLLLSRLHSAFTRRAGIEVNPEMAARSSARGFEMLGDDIYAAATLEPHRGAFDLVTAIALFEHVPRLREAVLAAVDLLAPGGLLLFEVPLLVEADDAGTSNHAWLTSSLEHLYYPTSRSLRHLFEQTLQVPLAGGELVVPGYGSTFIGLAARDAAVAEAAGRAWARLRSTPPDDLRPAERRARAFLHVLHGAITDRDDLACLGDLAPADVTEPVIHRVRELWTLDAERRDDGARASGELRAHVSELEGYVRDLERVRDETREELAAVQDQLTQADEVASSLQQALEIATDDAVAWERRAHALHTDAQLLIESTSWRVTAPIRGLSTFAQHTRRDAELLRPHLNRRRLRSAIALLRAGSLRTFAQRVRALRDTAAMAAGLAGVDVPSGPRVHVVNQPWPADQPLVSVVIPCFNYGAYVHEAVDSVLRQTLHRVEVIVVDGGSTDGTTPQELRRLKEAHPEVVVLFREGRHLVGDNRNHGIEHASGRYVCCLDADDLLAPIYLEIAVYLLEQHGYDIVSTATRSFGLREETFGLLPRPALADMLAANNVATVGVFRRELWEQAGGFHDVGLGTDYLYEDWKLWVRMAALGARIINIVGQQLFLYRVHGPSSLSNQDAMRDLAHHRDLIEAFNRDVVTPDAHELSRRRRDEVHVVENGLVNLDDPRDETVTVLLAMPFLIVGGADRILSQVAEHLAGRRFRIVLVTTVPVDASFGDTTGWFADATTEVYQLPRLLDPSLWRDFLDYVIKAKHVDLLWLAGSAFVYGELPRLRGENPRLRVVDQLWNTVGHTANNRRFSSCIDLTVVENAEVQRWLLRHGESADRIALVESGIDLRRYHPQERPVDQGPLRVGFSGRFSEEKDPLGFLDIAAATRARADIQYVMTGAGPLERQLRGRHRSLRLDGTVELLGMVDDVAEHLAGLDVLVLPSRLDGRPVVVLEALASGVPVIASAVGGLPRLVQEGRTGFLCPPGQPAAFAARLVQLADDRHALARMRVQARAHAEAHFDVGVMCRGYEQALLTVLDGGALHDRRA